jgi:carbonic anhydrase/acetyltransferase-like protein (isoleucine patch superfamily)
MTVDELRNLLLELRRDTDSRLKIAYDRGLPFGDGLFDRWERASRLGFGEGASIYDSSCVFGDVKVGGQTWIGPFTLLDGAGGGISIGDFCSISTGVHIYTHDTVEWALTGGLAERRTGAVSIGSCCYIGSQSVVTRGVSIGARSVVAANSLVNRDVAPLTIVAGTPARNIGDVEIDGKNVRFHFANRTVVPADLQSTAQ